MKIEKNIRDRGLYVPQVVLTNARLGFTRGENVNFGAKFSTSFSIGGLLFHNWQKYGKSKSVNK